MLKRAWLSITRNKSKTIILTILMFVIANLVLATIFIKNATEESMLYAKASLGSEVYLQPDMEKLMAESEQSDTSSEPKERFRIERPKISIDTVNTIADSSYVKDYSYSVSSRATAVNFDVVESSNTNFYMPGSSDTGNIQIEGVSAYAYIDGVKNKTITLSDGTYFDEDDNDKAVISYELASSNDLNIGDEITLKNSSTEEEITVEIIGIYTSTESDDERSFIGDSNKIYMNVETASKFLSAESYNEGNYSVNNVTYYLNNPEQSDAFIEEAYEKVPTLSDDNLTLDINSSAYESMVGPIESVGNFATTMLIIVIGASIIIISLLINNQVKDRKYEIGVLMSLGETKKNIVAQILLELLIISLFSFVLATATSLFVSDKMADSLLQNQIEMSEEQSTNNFGRPGAVITNGGPGGMSINNSSSVDAIDEINVVAHTEDYLMLLSIGFAIIFTSMLLPTINIMKYEPKTILTRRT